MQLEFFALDTRKKCQYQFYIHDANRANPNGACLNLGFINQLALAKKGGKPSMTFMQYEPALREATEGLFIIPNA